MQGLHQPITREKQLIKPLASGYIIVLVTGQIGIIIDCTVTYKVNKLLKSALSLIHISRGRQNLPVYYSHYLSNT